LLVKRTRRAHSAYWIRELLEIGIKPHLRIFQQCDAARAIWSERESFWIRSWLEAGHRLTNSTEGGDGGFTPEMRATFAGANNPFFGKQHTETTKEQLRRASARRRYSPEVNAKKGRSIPRPWAAANLAKGRRQLSLFVAKRNHENRKTDWLLFAPDGTPHYVTFISAFCAEHGLSESCIYRVADGSRRHHIGWRALRIPKGGTSDDGDAYLFK
jgi:hypothetical protein